METRIIQRIYKSRTAKLRRTQTKTRDEIWDDSQCYKTAVSEQMVIFGHFNSNNKMPYNGFATDRSEPTWAARKIFVDKTTTTTTTSKLLKSLHPFQMGLNTFPHTPAIRIVELNQIHSTGTILDTH